MNKDIDILLAANSPAALHLVINNDKETNGESDYLIGLTEFGDTTTIGLNSNNITDIIYKLLQNCNFDEDQLIILNDEIRSKLINF
jgi:hypothetical protein